LFVGISPDVDLLLMISRLLCALEGKYLANASCHDLNGGADESIQHLNFSCHIPNVTGRGFIEVLSLYHTPKFFYGVFFFKKSGICLSFILKALECIL